MGAASVGKPLNIREFAALAGVSTATVSRVFAEDEKVRPQTAQRVLRLARLHSFRPNTVAQSSFGAKTKSIGVLLCNLRTSYFADIALGIQAYLLPKGYLPIIISERSFARDYVSLRRLVDHRVDGLIACVGERAFVPEELAEIERFSLPVVTVDVWDDAIWKDRIASDEEMIGRLAAEYLVTAGHRNIFFYVESRTPLSMLPRFVACRKRLSELGVKIARQKYLSVGEENRVEATKEFLRRLPLPVACYAYNDNCALTIYRAAEELKLRIPQDISVIGTADLNFSAFLAPPLTTIRQDGQKTGRVAAECLLEMIGGLPPRGALNIPVELIERGSVLQIANASGIGAPVSSMTQS